MCTLPYPQRYTSTLLCYFGFLLPSTKALFLVLQYSFLCFLLILERHRLYYLTIYVDTKSKMSSSKKLTCKRTLRQVFICLRPPPLLRFCLGWSSNFVGSKSGQKQSVKLLQNLVSTGYKPPPPLPATHCLYILYFDTGKGEGGRESWTREELEGQQFTKLGLIYQHDWLYLQSINPAAKSLYRSIFLDDNILLWYLYYLYS